MVVEFCDSGKCVIFLMYIMCEVEKFCDWIVMVYCGYLLLEGFLEELVEKYGEFDLEEFFFKLILWYDEECSELLLVFMIKGWSYYYVLV